MQTTRLPAMLSLWLAACLLAIPAGARAQATPPAAEAHFLTLAGASLPNGTDGAGTAQFIGNATVLIRYQGITILTDPNFLHKGEHVNLGFGLRATRLTNPALELEQLPPIDLVLLSHLHEDHFDREVEQRLDANTPIATTPEAAARLGRKGFRQCIGLGLWETLDVQKGAARLRITALPARHGPAGLATLLPPVMGSMLDFAAGPAGRPFRIYISGDTVFYDELDAIPQRYPAVDLAVLHLGGARFLGLANIGMDGQDGARLLRLVAPARAIPVHYDDYDNFSSPLSAFAQAARAIGMERRAVKLRRGDTYSFTGDDAGKPSEQFLR